MGTLVNVVVPLACVILAAVLTGVTYVWQRNEKLHTQIRDNLSVLSQTLAVLSEQVKPILTLSKTVYEMQREIDKLDNAVGHHERGLREMWHILNSSGIRERFGHTEQEMREKENAHG